MHSLSPEFAGYALSRETGNRQRELDRFKITTQEALDKAEAHPDLEPEIRELLPTLRATLAASFLPEIVDNTTVLPPEHADGAGAAIIPFYRNERLVLGPSLERPTQQRLADLAVRTALPVELLSQRVDTLQGRRYEIGVLPGQGMGAYDINSLTTVHRQPVNWVSRGVIVVPVFKEPLPDAVHGALGVHELVHVLDQQGDFRTRNLTLRERLARHTTHELRGNHMTFCGIGVRGIIGYGFEDPIMIARSVEEERRWRMRSTRCGPFEATPAAVDRMVARGFVRDLEPS